jgi:rhamnose utilization protein RhaD (predicted bifunctional aldolase and dehydrogenase)
VHVDHVHSDAVIVIAASKDSEKLTREIFGNEMGYLPWQRPGIDLGIKLGKMATDHPEYVGVVLGSHGLFTWGKTAKVAMKPHCASSTRPPRGSTRTARSLHSAVKPQNHSILKNDGRQPCACSRKSADAFQRKR